MEYVFPWIFSIVSSGTIWKNAATNGEIGRHPLIHRLRRLVDASFRLVKCDIMNHYTIQ